MRREETLRTAMLRVVLLWKGESAGKRRQTGLGLGWWLLHPQATCIGIRDNTRCGTNRRTYRESSVRASEIQMRGLGFCYRRWYACFLRHEPLFRRQRSIGSKCVDGIRSAIIRYPRSSSWSDSPKCFTVYPPRPQTPSFQASFCAPTSHAPSSSSQRSAQTALSQCSPEFRYRMNLMLSLRYHPDFQGRDQALPSTT